MASFAEATVRRDRSRWPYAHLLAATDGSLLTETVHAAEAGLRAEVEVSAGRIWAGTEFRGKTPGSIIVDGLPDYVWMRWAGWDATTYEEAITAKLPADATRRYELRVHPRAYHYLTVAAYEKDAAPVPYAGIPGDRGLAEVRIDPSLPDGGWAIRSTEAGLPFISDYGILRGPRS